MINEELLKIIKEEGNYFEFPSFTFRCYAIRNKDLLTWCGYIEIDKNHPFVKDENENDYNYLQVHGGITWINKTNDHLILGFDANHYSDLSPFELHIDIQLDEYLNDLVDNRTYKNKQFVEGELKSLAKQIHELYPDVYNNTIKAIKKINEIK